MPKKIVNEIKGLLVAALASVSASTDTLIPGLMFSEWNQGLVLSALADKF